MHRVSTCVGGAVALCAAVGCGATDDGIDGERVGEATQAQTVCADGATLEGIDVSYYQGDIDWSAVAGDVDFAISRVNHGDFFDPEFEANWAESRQVGLIRGSYQYFDPGGDPVAQATTLIDAIGALEPGDLPPVIDVESTDGLGPSAIAANVGTWIDLVEGALGRPPIIYTGSYFWNDNVGTDAFVDHPLWIAHYTTGCPNLPTVWPDWHFWQYTSTGSVAGIAGNVDRNLFNGSVEQLHDLAADGLRAGVVSVTYPDRLRIGESGEVRIVLENLGARTWGAETKLGTTEPRDRASAFFAPGWDDMHRVTAMTTPVATGATAEIVFEIVAPAELGTHVEHFNLVEEGFAWFSDIVPGGGPSDDAIALTIDVVEGDPGDPDDPNLVDDDGPGGTDPSVVVSEGGGLGLEGQVSCYLASRAPAPSGSGRWLVGLLVAGGFVLRRRRS